MPSRAGRISRTLGVVGAGLVVCALWTLGAARLRAAPQRPAADSFSETTEVTVVQVPVQVVRNGEPVRGLTAADFNILDGRKPQKVTGFEVLDLAARQGPAVASIPPALRRHFLFLFDLAYSEPKSLLKAREMVRGMLPALHPSDLTAVATYSSARGPRLVLGFTSDRRQVLKAIDTLGLPEMMDRNPDPLDLIAADLAQQAQSGGGAAATARLQAALENVQDAARLADRGSRQQQQAVVGALSRGLADLARLLDNVHGRKEVIYLSEGFATSLLTGTEDQQQTQQMNDQVIHGQSFQVDSDLRFGDTRGTNVLEKMLEQFRRSDCIIQAVDIAGLRAQQDLGPSRPSGEGTLFTMAHDTGGELYRNFNDLGEAMDQVLKKTSLTYVLTFQPEDVKPDGTYHQLKVELKGSPATRGAQVFFRPGYYAPKPFAQRAASERMLSAAETVIGGGDSGPVPTALLAAPFRAAAGDKAYVPVVVEADGEHLMAGTQGNALPTEIYAYAIDSHGAITDFFTQSLRFDLAKVGPALHQSGIKFYGHLDLPPGEYNVRVLVRNGATGAYGLRAQPVTVPAFAQPDAVLLQPFFPEAPGRWLMVREAPRGEQATEAAAAPYPFMVQERPYVPSSRPVLTAGKDAAVALVGYHLPPGTMKAEARVLAVDGRDLGTGELLIGQRENPDPTGEDRLIATFRPPPGLAPGEYQLVIVLTDAQGQSHNSATRFVVPAAGGA